MQFIGNSLSLDNWLARGGTAHNGMAYGPPTSAYPYGTNGCPLAPLPYRSELGNTELPNEICAALGASNLTVADLSLDAWNQLNLHVLSPETRQELSAFLYRLPIPGKKVAIQGGLPISWLLALPTSPRLRNALNRHFQHSKRNDFLEGPIDCEEFLKIWGCGKTALIEFLCVVESVELGFVPEQLNPQKSSQPMSISAAKFQAAIQEATARVLRASDLLKGHFQDFAAWALSETEAKTVGEAITWARQGRSSEASWQAVADMELAELVEIPRHPYDIIESWMTDLPGREGYIFRNRVGLIRGNCTLQQLANELGISRERVRQLQKRTLSKFRSFTRKTAASPIRWRIETIKQMVGTAAPLEHVEQVLKPAEGQTDFRFVLLRIAGPYDITDGWIVLRSAVDNDPTEELCKMSDEIGFIDQALAERKLTEWGLHPGFHKEWLTRTGRIREFGGRLARWEGSIGDKLVIGLADLDRPTTVDVLLDYVQEDRSRGSALNALSSDNRVVRVNRKEWALASWGLTEYSSIAMSIRNLVSASGGRVHIEDVIAGIQNTFGSAEASVRAYCYAPMFVLEDSWVSLRHDLGTFNYPNASPRNARGVFALGPCRVSLLLEVNDALLRGSGRSLPSVVGAILRVPINQELIFRNEFGASISVTYPETSFLGPAMGSVRSLAESVGARLGQFLTLTLDRSNMVVTGVSTAHGVFQPSWRLVARLTGITASSGIEGLASALDCKVGEVRALLKSRGDEAVLQAIPTENSTSLRLYDALSRLEAQLQQN